MNATPIFAFLSGYELPILLVIAAVVFFGADKLPKLARSAGQAKKEFMMGQIEADEAAAKARAEMSAPAAPAAPAPSDEKAAPPAP